MLGGWRRQWHLGRAAMLDRSSVMPPVNFDPGVTVAQLPLCSPGCSPERSILESTDGECKYKASRACQLEFVYI